MDRGLCPIGNFGGLDDPGPAAFRRHHGDIFPTVAPNRHDDGLPTVDHVQEEVLARQPCPRTGQLGRIDDDVLGEAIGQNGKAAGHLQAQPMDAVSERPS